MYTTREGLVSSTVTWLPVVTCLLTSGFKVPFSLSSREVTASVESLSFSS